MYPHQQRIDVEVVANRGLGSRLADGEGDEGAALGDSPGRAIGVDL